jgi:hypothetical protein
MPKHSFDPLSLIFALVFGVVAVMAFVGPTDQLVDPRWIGPALLVLFGLMLLVPSQRSRRRNDPENAGGADRAGATTDTLGEDDAGQRSI